MVLSRKCWCSISKTDHFIKFKVWFHVEMSSCNTDIISGQFQYCIAESCIGTYLISCHILNVSLMSFCSGMTSEDGSESESSVAQTVQYFFYGSATQYRTQGSSTPFLFSCLSLTLPGFSPATALDRMKIKCISRKTHKWKWSPRSGCSDHEFS